MSSPEKERKDEKIEVLELPNISQSFPQPLDIYHHDPSKWPAFRTNYQKELDQKEELLGQIKRLEKQHKVVTLVFASKEERLNNAVVLLARLKSR